jgi:hypothetical protein
MTLFLKGSHYEKSTSKMCISMAQGAVNTKKQKLNRLNCA